METETNTKALAQEFVTRSHMYDWTQNERRQQLAADLGLVNHWQSHAAYLEARALAGMVSR